MSIEPKPDDISRLIDTTFQSIKTYKGKDIVSTNTSDLIGRLYEATIKTSMTKITLTEDSLKKIGKISEAKLEYYNSSTLGFIKKFFSALRNKIQYGIFLNSGSLGKKFVEIAGPMLTETPEPPKMPDRKRPKLTHKLPDPEPPKMPDRKPPKPTHKLPDPEPPKMPDRKPPKPTHKLPDPEPPKMPDRKPPKPTHKLPDPEPPKILLKPPVIHEIDETPALPLMLPSKPPDPELPHKLPDPEPPKILLKPPVIHEIDEIPALPLMLPSKPPDPELPHKLPDPEPPKILLKPPVIPNIDETPALPLMLPSKPFASSPPLSSSLFSTKEAMTLFTLYNLGSANVDAEDVHGNSDLILRFMISNLENLLEHHSVSQVFTQEEKLEVQILLKKYQKALEIERETQRIFQCEDVKLIPAKIGELQQTVVSSLIASQKKDGVGTLFLMSGYDAEPAGHAVGLEFALNEKDGKYYISGTLSNSGEGLKYHGQGMSKDSRIKYNPHLLLKETPLEDFEKSGFFKALIELQSKNILEASSDEQEKPIITRRPDTIKPKFVYKELSKYTIKDLYEGVLPLWPGGISCPTSIQGVAAQRGPTCTVKAAYSAAEGTVSTKIKAVVKLEAKLVAFQLFLNQLDHRISQIPHLKSAIGEIERKIYKMEKEGIPLTPTQKVLWESLSEEAETLLKTLNETVQTPIPFISSILDSDPSTAPITVLPVRKLQVIESQELPKIIFYQSLTKLSEMQRIMKVFEVDAAIEKEDVILEKNRLITEYLSVLPPATSPSWNDPSIPIEVLSKLFVIINLLNVSNKTINVSSAQDVIQLANVSAGVLKALKSKMTELHKASQNTSSTPNNCFKHYLQWIDREAGTVLGCINRVAPQLRVHQSDLRHRLISARTVLEELNESKRPLDTYSVGSSFWFSEQNVMFTSELSINESDGYPPLAFFRSLLEQHKCKVLNDRTERPRYSIDLPYFDQPLEQKRSSEVSLFKQLKHLNPNPLDATSSEADRESNFLHQSYNIMFDISSKLKWCTAQTTQLGVGDTEAYYHRDRYIIGYYLRLDLIGHCLRLANRSSNPQSHDLISAYLPEVGNQDKQTYEAALYIMNGFGEEIRSTPNSRLITMFYPSIQMRYHSPYISPPLTIHELELLASIHLSDEATIPQCIEYYSQYTNRLKDPYFQAFFEGFMWLECRDKESISVLENALHTTSNHSAEQLLQFCEKIINTDDNNSIDQQLIITRLVCQMSTFLTSQEIEKCPAVDQPKLIQRRKEITDLIHKSLGKLGAYTHQFQDPNTVKIHHWIVSFYPYIKDDPSCKQQLLQSCLFTEDPSVDYKFDQRRILQVDFSLGRGALLSEIQNSPESYALARSDNHLPHFIRDSKKYVLTNSNPFVTKTSPNTYEFEDNGIPTKLTVSGKDFEIQQLLTNSLNEKEWFMSFQRAIGAPDISNYPFANEKLFGKKDDTLTEKWVSREHPDRMIIKDPFTKKVMCYVTQKGIHHADHPNLLLASQAFYKKKDPFLEQLKGLQDPNLCLWKDETGLLKQIEFPVYGLKFTCEGGPDGKTRWMSATHPGFFLDDAITHPQLSPFRHYLILKNNEGTRKVIMPSLMIHYKKPTFLKDNEFKTLLSESELKDRVLLEYPIDRKGKLRPPYERAHLLYLVHLALRNLNYSKAMNLINILSLLKEPWSDREIKMIGIGWVTDPIQTDKNPKACALRIKLCLLAKRSAVAIDNDGMLRDYKICLEHRNRISIDWISAEDQATLSELFPDISKVESVLYPKIKKDLRFDISDSTRKKMTECLLKPSPIILKTRPGQAFIDNFLYYYQVALTGTPLADHDELITILRCSRFLSFDQPDDNNTEYWLRAILLSVATQCTNLNQSVGLPSIEELEKLKTGQTLTHYLRDLSKRILITSPLRDPTTIPEWELIEKLKPSSESMKILHKPNPIHLKRAVAIPWEEASESKQFYLVETQKILSKVDDELTTLLSNFDRSQKQDIEKKLTDNKNNLLSLKAAFAYEGDDYRKHTFDRIVKGIDEKLKGVEAKFEELKKPEYSPSLPKDISTLEGKAKLLHITTQLDTAISAQEARVKELETNLMKRLHNYPPELAKQVKIGLIVPMNLKRLILAYGSGEGDQILHSNPSLHSHFAEFKQQITEYLIEKTEVQQLIRSRKQLEVTISIGTKKGWNSTAGVVAQEKFISSLMAKRQYKVGDTALPAFLTFELLRNVRLRSTQFDTLTKIANGSLDHYDIEQATGSGKSSVTIPLWLILTRRFRPKTMMTVPAYQFDDQKKLLQELLGETFFTAVEPLRFGPTEAATLESIQKVRKKLEDIAKPENKTILLVDIKSLHFLTKLALLEQTLKASSQIPSEDLNLRIEELRKIRTLICSFSNFIDESKDCLDPLQLYTIASGKPKRVELPVCDRAQSFFANVVLHPDITKKWNFECIPTSPQKSVLTRENYVELQKLYIDKTMEFLHLTGHPQQLMLKKCLSGEIPPKEINAILSKMKKHQAEDFVWCYEQLNLYLSGTLLRKSPEDYLLDSKRLAMPCRNGSPKVGSEFTTQEHLINATLLGNLLKPIEDYQIEDFCNSIPPGVTPETNHSLQFFEKVRAAMNSAKEEQKTPEEDFPTLHNITQKDPTRFAKFINENLSLRLEFIGLTTLPTITSYPEQITSTSFDVVADSEHVLATSGTTNTEILHPKFKPDENVSAPIGNLAAVWQNSEVKVSDTTKPVDTLKNLLQNPKQYTTLIDAAGLFGKMSQEDIIKTIFAETADRIPPILAITCYDEDGVALIFERGLKGSKPRSLCQCSLENIFVFIRQSKAIGSDPPMDITAQGAVTLKADLPLSFVMQAYSRMRGLEEGQQIDLWVQTIDKQLITQSKDKDLDKKTLFRHLTNNETDDKSKGYLCSLQVRLKNLVSSIVWKYQGNTDEFITLCSKLKSVLKQSTHQEIGQLKDLSKNDVNTKDVIAAMVEKELGPIEALIKQDPTLKQYIDIEQIKKDFKDPKIVKFEKMAPKTSISANLLEDNAHADANASVDQEQSQDSNANRDQIQEEQRELPRHQFRSDNTVHQVANFGEYFAPNHLQNELFGIPIYQSKNFSTLSLNPECSKYIRKRAHQMLLRKMGGEFQLLAIDLSDHKMILGEDGEKRFANDGSTYYLIAGDQILFSKGDSNSPTNLCDIPQIDKDEEMKIRLIYKFRSGARQLSLEEVEWLKKCQQEGRLTDEIKLFKEAFKKHLTIWPQMGPFADQLRSV